MKQLRKLIFWLHLIAGSVAGLVILTVATTGILLTYERQMIDWAQRGLHAPPPPGTPRLPFSALLKKAQESEGGTAPTSVTWRADATAPVTIGFGRERTVYFNPHTGASLGEGAKGTRDFFHLVTDIHRWFALEGQKRPIGKAITGASAMTFLLLVLSGLVLWWPRQWRWKAVKSVMLFDGRLSGRPRDWNWHNVFGFWACWPLLISLLTGLVMSYTWANNLLFRLTGNEPPPPKTEGARPQTGQPKPAGGESRARESGGRRGEGGRGPVNFEQFDKMAARAEQQVPGWQMIAWRQPGSFMIDQSHRGRPDQRTMLTFDPKTGEIVTAEPFTSQNLGKRLRQWVRWVHTGEAGGIAGQTLAGCTALAAVMLVWTGLALALRRLGTWRRRRAGLSTAKTATDNRPVVSSLPTP